MRQLTYLFLVLTLLFVGSCTETPSTEPIKPTDPTESVDHKFKFSTNSLGTESTNITNVNAYVFSAGTLVKIIVGLPITESTVTINVPVNTQIYFLAGIGTSPSSMSSLEENKTSVETFLSLCADPMKESEASTATQFLTGYYEGVNNTEKAVHDITMTRSVARLDLDTSSDPLIKINRIIVKNVPLSTLIFENNKTIDTKITTTTAETIFDTPISGKSEGFMYLYESSQSIPMTLYGTYNDVPIVVNITIPSLERNSAYTVKVNNTGTSVNGSITIKPWDQGGVIEGNPDLNTSVSIDMLHTSADNGIAIDNQANHIRISENGGMINLALTAETPLAITSIEGNNPLISVGSPVSETVENKFITRISISASAQEKGSLPYQVKIALKSPLTQNPYDYVTIDVDGNQNQIPTVTFAGYEIMAFNTTGSQLSDQVYIPEGSSVIDMYNKNWTECTGKMFQFGRPLGYYPHENKKPTTIPEFMEWSETNGAPCPAGFRMLTNAELKKIMPPSKDPMAINGTEFIDYYIGSKVAKMEIIVPSVSVSMGNIRNIIPRYVRLTCEGETLIFPMAGYKWTDGNGAGAATLIGSSFFMMGSTRDKDYTTVCGHDSGRFQNGHSNKQPRNLNNYNFVRCVKK